MSVETVVQEVETVPADWEPKIIGFLCYWCSYSGADSAGTARMQYAPNVDIIKVMCSGRIDPEMITTAFSNGADAVLVAGCHIGDCHYMTGNHKTMARMPLMKRILLELGIEEDRFRHEWISAAEGEKFAKTVSDLTEKVRELGPLNWPELMHERGVGHGKDLKPWGE